MKLVVMCARCAFPPEDEVDEQPPPTLPHVSVKAAFGPDEEIPLLVEVEVEDCGLYRVTCALGHQTELVLSAPKFDVLFESGAYAFLDGYYREAASSFAAALERFYEHWIKAVLLNSSDSDPNSVNLIGSAYKLVAAQSERQLGGFVFLYLREFGAVPKLLPDRWTRFRNDVIHKGEIPKRSDVFSYGEAIALYIAGLYRELYEKSFDGLNLLRGIHMEQSRNRSSNRDDVRPMTLPSVLSAVTGLDNISGMTTPTGIRLLGAKQATFEQALDDLQGRRRGLKPGRRVS